MSKPSPSASFAAPPAITPQPIKTFRLPQLGKRIFHGGYEYTIGSSLGQGVFGAVWECSDLWGNQLAAKVILPNELPYETIRDAWNLELGKLLQLRHPNITFLHDAFEYDDTFYLILERCTSTLKDLLAWRDLKGEIWVLPLARCILQAVEFIHRAGLVHKDLHAGNVYTTHVRDELTPWSVMATTFKVGDLGISGPIDQIDWFNTKLAQWMLPPEVLGPGSFGSPGKLVDIYHCGLLLLSLLLGSEVSFTEAEVAAGVPRNRAEALGTPLGDAVAVALRRHVGSRPQSALEMWRAVSAAGQAQGLVRDVGSDIG